MITYLDNTTQMTQQSNKGVIILKTLHMVAFALVIVGGINWGLVGLLNTNLVSMIFGMGSTPEQLVYILVGLSAVVLVLTHMQDCKTCSKK